MMMAPMLRQAITAIGIGAALLALGLLPGLLSALKEGIRYFRSPFSLEEPSPATQRLAEQIWLVVGGVVLVTLGLLALTSN
jgi:hypothetical protein